MTTSELLFGTKLAPVSASEMARLTGVDKSTVCRWKRNPDSIPLGKLKIIAKVRGLSGDNLMTIMKER